MVVGLLFGSTVAWAGSKVQTGQFFETFGLKRLVPAAGEASVVYPDNYVGEDAKAPAKALLLGFFASWCKPCMAEFPQIQQIEAKYRDRGLVVIMVNIDRDGEGLEKATRYVKKQKPSFAVLSDRMNIVARRYFDDEFNLPASFLIAPDGRIKTMYVGGEASEIKRIEQDIRRMLGVHDEASNKKQVAKKSSKVGLRAKVTKVKGVKAWIDKGHRDGVAKEMNCRIAKKDGSEGRCHIERVVGSLARIRSEEGLASGDVVILK